MLGICTHWLQEYSGDGPPHGCSLTNLEAPPACVSPPSFVWLQQRTVALPSLKRLCSCGDRYIASFCTDSFLRTWTLSSESGKERGEAAWDEVVAERVTLLCLVLYAMKTRLLMVFILTTTCQTQRLCTLDGGPTYRGICIIAILAGQYLMCLKHST